MRACVVGSLVGIVLGLVSAPRAEVVDATALRGKVLAGYQGWFRAPGDGSSDGWMHWARGKEVTPETVSVEMWPEMKDFTDEEKYPVPGFTHPDGRQASLFSSANARTVKRHFEWMRDYGIDGVWMQHFVVDFANAPGRAKHAVRRQVIRHVSAAAQDTGRVWALTFDMTGMPENKVFDHLADEWRSLVDEGLTKDGRYLHQDGKPVLMIFGFFSRPGGNYMTTQTAERIIEHFKKPGPYQAFLGGAGEWYWRKNENPEWQKIFMSFDAWQPWNPGHYVKAKGGIARAGVSPWADDKKRCDEHGVLWIPTIYPGFGWSNLKRNHEVNKPSISRRGGEFFWEQFHELNRIGADSAMVAMFDEVDEGTAIFKVSNEPPTQAEFSTYEGLPSDWYLRLTGEATRLLREKQAIPAAVPFKP